jgi:hypothetical protein
MTEKRILYPMKYSVRKKWSGALMASVFMKPIYAEKEEEALIGRMRHSFYLINQPSWGI